MSTFASFALSKNLVHALDGLGYHSPSPVQSRIIPKALRGQSLVCQSETGSGKTHAYLVPMLEQIDMYLPKTQGIIICPSRELARQVYEFANAFTRYFPKLKVRLFTSEAEKSQNSAGLTVPPHIVIGTPGRLADLLTKDYELDLHQVRMLVLDEADMLLEQGYFDDIDAIYDLLGEKVQTMVFSATLHQGLKDHLSKYIGASFVYEGEDHKTASSVTHHLVDIKHMGTFEALTRFLKIKQPYLAMIFASKKEDVQATYNKLRENGYDCIMFSGDLDARQRKQTLKRIKSNTCPLIVCSDLLSRGMDIEDVSDVISLDLPSDLSYYYHRAGRTGRFDKKGDSWVFYNSDSTKRPLELISQGLQFEFLTLKEDRLAIDPVGLLPKRKFTSKKPFEGEQATEIKIAKAKTRVNKVKPGYKKKQKEAVEKVKRKYRRKAIKEKIKEHKRVTYTRNKNTGGDE